jgi:hypothetical protein
VSEHAIYTPASVPALGELGPATLVERPDVCPVCGRQPPGEFRFVEFVFDSWDGEDLVTAMDVYVASERLRDALERAGVTGAQFEVVKVSKSDYFEFGEGAYAPDLPRFYRLVFVGRARGPETWWTSDTCEGCGVTYWERTELGGEASMAVALGEAAPPREVYRSSWSGHDLFTLQDPGPPLATERTMQVFTELSVKEVTFQPAKWVSDGVG